MPIRHYVLCHKSEIRFQITIFLTTPDVQQYYIRCKVFASAPTYTTAYATAGIYGRCNATALAIMLAGETWHSPDAPTEGRAASAYAAGDKKRRMRHPMTHDVCKVPRYK